MLTAERNNSVSNSQSVTQSETVKPDGALSTEEILRRVRDIKSTWSPAERAARRAEAERRFDNLVDTIFDAAA